MLKNFAQLITYPLVPEAPIEQISTRNRIFQNLSKEPGFNRFFWGCWNEELSFLDIIITWTRDPSDGLSAITLQHLAPLNAYLSPGSKPRLQTLESPLAFLNLGKKGGAHVSITSFQIPESVCVEAGPEIQESIFDTFQALACGTPRHGSNHVPPPEGSIPLARKIETATGQWDSAWVVEDGTLSPDSLSDPKPSSSNEKSTINDTPPPAYRHWLACVQWKRPHLETRFKGRPNRHWYLDLQLKLKGKGTDGMRGIDNGAADSNVKNEEEVEEYVSIDPVAATEGFWKPITETWQATFEEHHVVFCEIREFNELAKSPHSWLSCVVQ